MENQSTISPSVLTATEKQAALDLVLESTAFVRAPQLRNFLRYIGDMEICGRASELNEYLVGVEALGRQPGYSTTDDSTVRRRAHALRQKLEEVYATQLSGATHRVELPKGSYVPHFYRWSSETESKSELAGASPATEQTYPAHKRFGWGAIAVAVLAGALFPMLLMISRSGGNHTRKDTALEKAWAAFLQPDTPVTICVASPLHFGILPYPEDGPLPPRVPDMPVQSDLLPFYQSHYPLPPGERLRAHMTTGPIRLGEVRGVVTIIRAMDDLGVKYDLIPEKDISVPALRGRNLVLFANPEYSFAASAFLEKANLSVSYNPATRERVIREQRPTKAPRRMFVPTRDARQNLSEVFGLITVLPSEGPSGDNRLQTVIFSCTNSAGCEAAAEFFGSQQKMSDFKELLVKEGHRQFPRAYQIVIRARVHASQTVSGTYEWHYVPSAS